MLTCNFAFNGVDIIVVIDGNFVVVLNHGRLFVGVAVFVDAVAEQLLSSFEANLGFFGCWKRWMGSLMFDWQTGEGCHGFTK